ncbi:hypothetical protein [Streptomyces sp. NPDC006285]|uniref:MFS transporter small subunit n=1 Tax=Streptomyces sp. NPDC006285 TaxID=3364742 RepID=UPI0036A0D2D6
MSTSDSSPPDDGVPDNGVPGLGVPAGGTAGGVPADGPAPDRRALIAFAWVWVGAPLAYGLYELVRKATQLFTG